MNTETKICPMCEIGTLTPITFAEDFQHRGSSLHVEGLEGYECHECGADPVLKTQILRNQTRIADAKRHADGLLTGQQIRIIRKALNLSQQDAAVLFGGGANAFSKYERGDVTQSVAMDRLLRLVKRHPFLLNELREHAGLDIEPIQPIAYANDDYSNNAPIHLESGIIS